MIQNPVSSFNKVSVVMTFTYGSRELYINKDVPLNYLKSRELVY